MIPTEGGFPTTEGGIGLINCEIRKKSYKKQICSLYPTTSMPDSRKVYMF